MDTVPAASDGATLGPPTDPTPVADLREPASEPATPATEPPPPVPEPADDQYVPI